MSFIEKLQQAQAAHQSRLCVGLDPHVEKLPESVRRSPTPLYDFCREIVAATAEAACCFKPNVAFFEAGGAEGIRQLEKLMADIPVDIPVILDAKRGDIGNTSRMYARFLFEHLGGDAATVSPYLGTDSLEPFLEFPGHCMFVLCVTSNPGAADFQFYGSPPLYHRVIAMCRKLAETGEVGLVAGATHLEQMREIRSLFPDGPLLVPGLGVQGGDLSAAARAATRDNTVPAVFNVSRGILYAGSGTDFAEQARKKALEYQAAINDALKNPNPVE
jgi:orotidine-5'-phosphate decarboxylase